jgi:hypothetical protein
VIAGELAEKTKVSERSELAPHPATIESAPAPR